MNGSVRHNLSPVKVKIWYPVPLDGFKDAKPLSLRRNEESDAPMNGGGHQGGQRILSPCPACETEEKVLQCIMASSSTQRWSSVSLLSLAAVVVAFLATPGSCWSPQGSVVRPPAMRSALFVPLSHQPYRRKSTGQLFSSEKEESEETEATSSSSDASKLSSDEDDVEAKFGIVKTILLAGPLFIKFTIVLL